MVKTKENLSFKKVSKIKSGEIEEWKSKRTQRGMRHKNWHIMPVTQFIVRCFTTRHKGRGQCKASSGFLPEIINHKYLLHYFSKETNSSQVLIQNTHTHTHTNNIKFIYI